MHGPRWNGNKKHPPHRSAEPSRRSLDGGLALHHDGCTHGAPAAFVPTSIFNEAAKSHDPRSRVSSKPGGCLCKSWTPAETGVTAPSHCLANPAEAGIHPYRGLFRPDRALAALFRANPIISGAHVEVNTYFSHNLKDLAS